jgi:hypothetical protein
MVLRVTKSLTRRASGLYSWLWSGSLSLLQTNTFYIFILECSFLLQNLLLESVRHNSLLWRTIPYTTLINTWTRHKHTWTRYDALSENTTSRSHARTFRCPVGTPSFSQFYQPLSDKTAIPIHDSRCCSQVTQGCAQICLSVNRLFGSNLSICLSKSIASLLMPKLSVPSKTPS